MKNTTQGNRSSGLKSKYLYGDFTPDPIPKSVIDNRVRALRVHLETLLNVPYLERDDVRINKVVKAISFWERINDNN